MIKRSSDKNHQNDKNDKKSNTYNLLKLLTKQIITTKLIQLCGVPP